MKAKPWGRRRPCPAKNVCEPLLLKVAQIALQATVGNATRDDSEHLNFTTPVPRKKFEVNAEVAPSSVPGEKVVRAPKDMHSMLLVAHAIRGADGSEGEVIPDSQMDEPDSRSHHLQGKQKMSTRQEIEAMKTNMRNMTGVSSTKDTRRYLTLDAQQQRGDGNSHAESVLFTHVLPKMLLTLDETTLFFYSFRTKSDTVKENHERLNKWLTDYVRTPQDNAEVERQPVGSKRVPSSRGGNSKTTSTAVGSSHIVATLDIIEIDDDSDDVAEFEEDQTVERDAARASPLKNGKRLTSKVSPSSNSCFSQCIHL